tara:strand:+ start:90494 stop:91393 length:900 start_codon:yes stop_codon:yes gene_type:complete
MARTRPGTVKLSPDLTEHPISQKELLRRLGVFISTCGLSDFPVVLQEFFEDYCQVSDFTILTFQRSAIPTPVHSSIASHDQNLTRYCNGLYLLDPFYALYHSQGFTGFARFEDISSSATEDRIKPYWNYIQDWGNWDELGYIIPVSKAVSLHLSLGRNQGSPPFEASVTRLLEDLYPFLRPLVERHWHDLESKLCSNHSLRQSLHKQVESILHEFGSSVLTQREREVVQAMLKGYQARAIAERLSIRPGTVNVHRANIYQKLDISSKSELFSLFFGAVSSVDAAKGGDILADYFRKKSH